MKNWPFTEKLYQLLLLPLLFPGAAPLNAAPADLPDPSKAASPVERLAKEAETVTFSSSSVAENGEAAQVFTIHLTPAPGAVVDIVFSPVEVTPDESTPSQAQKFIETLINSEAKRSLNVSISHVEIVDHTDNMRSLDARAQDPAPIEIVSLNKHSAGLATPTELADLGITKSATQGNPEGVNSDSEAVERQKVVVGTPSATPDAGKSQRLRVFAAIFVGTSAGIGQALSLAYSGSNFGVIAAATVVTALYELVYQYQIQPITRWLTTSGWFKLTGKPSGPIRTTVKNFAITGILALGIRTALDIIGQTPILSGDSLVETLKATGILTAATTPWYRALGRMEEAHSENPKRGLGKWVFLVPAALTILTDSLLALEIIGYKFQIATFTIPTTVAWITVGVVGAAYNIISRNWYGPRVPLLQSLKKLFRRRVPLGPCNRGGVSPAADASSAYTLKPSTEFVSLPQGINGIRDWVPAFL